MGVKKPITNVGRELAPVILLDDGNHHIKGGDAARTGDPVAVDLEQRWHDGDIGKGLAEGRQMFPVERGAAFIEETRSGEEIRSAGNSAEDGTSAGEPPEPGEHRAIVEKGRVAAGTDKDHVGSTVGAGAA